MDSAERLKRRVAIVTGAAQGMGESFARQLAGAGACVAIADINAALGRLVADSIGANALFVDLDVSSGDAWRHAIDMTERQFGPISILVNNAGIAWFESLEKSPESAARRMIDVDQ